jgi:sterol desaturase/sphingolipid hydroxylase (fatty acid hydroxylase superfamily)
VPLTLFFSGLQNLVVHVNTDIRLGRLAALFTGPAHHRLHHNVVISKAQNFGTRITLRDRMFGTHVSHVKTPQQVGIAQPDTFTDTAEIVGSQLHPLR